jgi:cobalt-precorrin-5B (C1)-methyltransferase
VVIIFGGTTEGRKVAELFDVIGQEYFYSTKNDTQKNIKGRRIFGGMDSDEMIAFCSLHQIRLIVDAAHPFAVELHHNIHRVSEQTGLQVIR